jgi:hypothetical protein
MSDSQEGKKEKNVEGEGNWLLDSLQVWGFQLD